MTESNRNAMNEQSLGDHGVIIRRGKSGAILSLDFRAATDAQFAWSELLRFPKLRELFLDGCDFSDADLNHVGNLERLQTLSLRQTNVSDVGADGLVKLKKLSLLHLSTGQLSDDFLAQLRKRMIGARIVVQ